MTAYTFYRTDDRAPDKVSPGFFLKTHMAPGKIKTRLKEWFAEGLVYSKTAEHMANAKDYAISVDTSLACGGYDKKFKYKFYFESLELYTPEQAGLETKNDKDKSETKLLMDKATIDAASVIAVWVAINGRENEYSFYSSIASKYITEYAEFKSKGEYNDSSQFHGRTEHLGASGKPVGKLAGNKFSMWEKM